MKLAEGGGWSGGYFWLRVLSRIRHVVELQGVLGRLNLCSLRVLYGYREGGRVDKGMELFSGAEAKISRTNIFARNLTNKYVYTKRWIG